MCLPGLSVLGFKALSRTPAVIALVVLILSVVVLVTLTLIQFHHKEILLPGLKVSAKGSALKGWAVTSVILRPWIRWVTPSPVGEDQGRTEGPLVWDPGEKLEVLALWWLTLQINNSDASPRTVWPCFDSWLLEPKLDFVAKNYRRLPKPWQSVRSPRPHNPDRGWRPGDPAPLLAWPGEPDISDFKRSPWAVSVQPLLSLKVCQDLSDASPRKINSGPYARFQRLLMALLISLAPNALSDGVRQSENNGHHPSLGHKGDRRWSCAGLSNEGEESPSVIGQTLASFLCQGLNTTYFRL